MEQITRTRRIKEILAEDGGWLCRSQIHRELRLGDKDARHISQYINNLLRSGWLQRRMAKHPERTAQKVYFYKLRKKQISWAG